MGLEYTTVILFELESQNCYSIYKSLSTHHINPNDITHSREKPKMRSYDESIRARQLITKRFTQ